MRLCCLVAQLFFLNGIKTDSLEDQQAENLRESWGTEQNSTGQS